MMWKLCFVLSIVSLAAGVIGFFIQRQKGKNEVRYLGAGVFLACIAMCFPGMSITEQKGFALIMSVSHSIRMFVVDTGISDILSMLSADALGMLFYPYKILVCLLYLLAPVFTLSVVLRYFSNFFEYFRLLIRRKYNLYIFSELNARSLEIASKIFKELKNRNERTGIVFCHSNEKDDINTELEKSAKEIGAILISAEMIRLQLNNKKRYISYFHISDNDEKNVDDTLQMIDDMTGDSPWLKSGKLNQNNTAIYCYTVSPEAEILIDAKDKESLRVVLMDEVRDAVYEHLYRYPLYSKKRMPGIMNKQDNKKEKLSLLIVGGGKTGTEFLKAAVWCGQMDNFQLDIHVIDLKGNLIQKQMQKECPELFIERTGYAIDIHKVNMFSNKVEEYLDTLSEICYCAVCLGDDEENIRAAMWLKKYYYYKQHEVQPLICAYIKSDKKRNALWNMHENTREGKRLYYGIIPFGNRGMYFNNWHGEAFVLEYLGLGVQAHYWRLNENSSDEDRKNAIIDFYNKQGNRRSSIASGLHISSKLWELGLGIIRVPHNSEERKEFDRYIHPVDFRKETAGKLAPFYNLEHERWMAYIRTEGWRLATAGEDNLDDIRKCYEGYCAQFKNQNHMMKLHPALVPIEKKSPEKASLQEVDDMIVEVNKQKKLNSYKPQYIQSDVEIVNHIGDIVGGTWCGNSKINIHGIFMQEGECVICKLSDMLKYYQYLDEKQNEDRTPEENIISKLDIERCRNGLL